MSGNHLRSVNGSPQALPLGLGLLFAHFAQPGVAFGPTFFIQVSRQNSICISALQNILMHRTCAVLALGGF